MISKERAQIRSCRKIKSMRESRKETIKRILSSQENSLDFLREAGIFDKTGKLSELYKK